MPAKNVAITGAVRANGLTIGSASSGATEFASATTLSLYTFMWNNLSNSVCPVTGGRGASAAADFAANKPIGLPDLRGMVLAGLDDNSAASRLTSLTMSPDGITAMATGGGQSLTFLQAYLPNVNWAVTDPGHAHSMGGAVPLIAIGSNAVGGSALLQATTAQAAAQAAETEATASAV